MAVSQICRKDSPTSRTSRGRGDNNAQFVSGIRCRSTVSSLLQLAANGVGNLAGEMTPLLVVLVLGPFQFNVSGNGNVASTHILGQGQIGKDGVHIEIDYGLPQGLADGILLGMLGDGRVDDAIDGGGMVVLMMEGGRRVLLDGVGGSGHHHG